MGRTYSNSDSVEIIIDDKLFDVSKSFAEWFANNIYRASHSAEFHDTMLSEHEAYRPPRSSPFDELRVR